MKCSDGRRKDKLGMEGALNGVRDQVTPSPFLPLYGHLDKTGIGRQRFRVA